MGIVAQPDKDSIHISDTIWLSVANSTTLQDISSGTSINFGGAKNLGTLITLLQFNNDNLIDGAINKFQLLLIEGSNYPNVTDPASRREYIFTEQRDTYRFKLGIIPADTGRFVLTVSDAANVYRDNDKCTKAGFEIDYQNTNQHFYFLNIWRPDLVLDDLGKKKVYYFKVVP
ncbi:MAG: hypothetical protein JSS70_19765 [Bacteroidetes bacterium]|nr:hypothetical protein [Bacteroidota bacterium]